MELLEIGAIVRLQVQRTSLKVGEKPNRVYDTSPLLSVQQIRISPYGAIALRPDGETALDVHHIDHPKSQNAGVNSISIGFTPHYARMREHYGDHLFDGCAGENILIETSEPFALDDLEEGVLIRGGDGEVWLKVNRIARPCLEFSRYAMRLPLAERESAEIKGALQFLDGGTRGFYTTPQAEASLSLGDRVYLPVRK